MPTRLPEFVGSADYLSLYNEALRNDGEGPQFSDELIAHYRNNDDPDLYPNTNWIDELLRKNTFSHRYTLNVRGGTESQKYFCVRPIITGLIIQNNRMGFMIPILL